MKTIFIKLCIISLLLLFFGCRFGRVTKRTMRIEAIKPWTTVLNKDCEIAFDSVSVIKKDKRTDSLSFYKNKVFVGSSIIYYEK